MLAISIGRHVKDAGGQFVLPGPFDEALREAIPDVECAFEIKSSYIALYCQSSDNPTKEVNQIYRNET